MQATAGTVKGICSLFFASNEPKSKLALDLGE